MKTVCSTTRLIHNSQTWANKSFFKILINWCRNVKNLFYETSVNRNLLLLFFLNFLMICDSENFETDWFFKYSILDKNCFKWFSWKILFIDWLLICYNANETSWSSCLSMTNESRLLDSNFLEFFWYNITRLSTWWACLEIFLSYFFVISFF